MNLGRVPMLRDQIRTVQPSPEPQRTPKPYPQAMRMPDIHIPSLHRKATVLRKSEGFRKPSKADILVTAELEIALEECKHKVERIAKDCKVRNRKFRYAERTSAVGYLFTFFSSA